MIRERDGKVMDWSGDGGMEMNRRDIEEGRIGRIFDQRNGVAKGKVVSGWASGVTVDQEGGHQRGTG